MARHHLTQEPAGQGGGCRCRARRCAVQDDACRRGPQRSTAPLRQPDLSCWCLLRCARGGVWDAQRSGRRGAGPTDTAHASTSPIQHSAFQPACRPGRSFVHQAYPRGTPTLRGRCLAMGERHRHGVAPATHFAPLDNKRRRGAYRWSSGMRPKRCHGTKPRAKPRQTTPPAHCLYITSMASRPYATASSLLGQRQLVSGLAPTTLARPTSPRLAAALSTHCVQHGGGGVVP